MLPMLRWAAHAGIGSIRCKWGSVQEATALWELMHAVPEGRLEEVGLCRVEPAVLQKQYGFAEGTLPPMGASPDGLIRQRQSLPQPSHASAVRTVLLACFDQTREGHSSCKLDVNICLSVCMPAKKSRIMVLKIGMIAGLSCTKKHGLLSAKRNLLLH